MQKKGNKYGTHRVIEPQGLLTQAAKKIDNTMECWSNEILCDVSALNIDSASFTQIYEACGKDLGKTEQMILDIVNERGKMQNPVTGSGGMMCCYEAMKRVGPTGNVVALVICQEDANLLKSMNLCHHAIVGSATNPTEVLEKSLAVNGGKEYDVSILIVNVPACEMAAILPVRDNGTVYFFSMATDFAKAALGAEGCGKDVTMIVGNGYTKDHAEITLSELRENAKLKEYFEKKYL